jgi:hypothetical protein
VQLLYDVISIIGSFEKNAAVKGAPHKLSLASIKVDLLKGDEYSADPVFFID